MIIRLALLVLVVIAGVAHADQVACRPPLEIMRGEPNVTRERVQRDLLPAAPTDLSITIFTEAGEQSIAAWGTYPPTMESLHIDVNDGDGIVHVRTKDRFTCFPTMIFAGTVLVEVRAVDAGGNESEPFKASVEASFRKHGHRHRGMPIGLLLLIPVFFVGGGIGVLVIRAMRNAQLAKPGDPIPAAVAESVARTLLRNHAIATSIGTVAVIVAGLAEAYVTAVCLASVPLVGFSSIFSCLAALRYLGREDMIALKHGTYLVVGGLKRSANVRASERLFLAAQRLPAATAKIRE